MTYSVESKNGGVALCNSINHANKVIEVAAVISPQPGSVYNIVDLETGEVVESFTINERGRPVLSFVNG